MATPAKTFSSKFRWQLLQAQDQLNTIDARLPSLDSDPIDLFTPCTTSADHARLETVTNTASPLRYQVWGLLWDFEHRAIRWDESRRGSRLALLTAALAAAMALRPIAMPYPPQMFGLRSVEIARAYRDAARAIALLREADSDRVRVQWSPVLRKLAIIATVHELSDAFERAAMLADATAHEAFGQRSDWETAEVFHQWKRRILRGYDKLQGWTPDFPFFNHLNAGLMHKSAEPCVYLCQRVASACPPARQYIEVIDEIEKRLGQLVTLLYLAQEV